MDKFGCFLLIACFLIVLAYPPASAVVVPAFSLWWIVHYINKKSRDD